jgi:hypothetical protein
MNGSEYSWNSPLKRKPRPEELDASYKKELEELKKKKEIEDFEKVKDTVHKGVKCESDSLTAAQEELITYETFLREFVYPQERKEKPPISWHPTRSAVPAKTEAVYPNAGICHFCGSSLHRYADRNSSALPEEEHLSSYLYPDKRP